MKKIILVIITLLISIPVWAQTFRVESVIDGDTLKLTNGERVGLIGVDTAESKSNNKAKRDSQRKGADIETINKLGVEATEFVRGLVKENQEVRLEFDVQKKDEYGRLLAYVYLYECSNCLIEGFGDYEYKYIEDSLYIYLNGTLIKSGYAAPMTIPPNVKHTDLFSRLYEEARENKRGLWGESTPQRGLNDFFGSSKPKVEKSKKGIMKYINDSGLIDINTSF